MRNKTTNDQEDGLDTDKAYDRARELEAEAEQQPVGLSPDDPRFGTGRHPNPFETDDLHEQAQEEPRTDKQGDLEPED